VAAGDEQMAGAGEGDVPQPTLVALQMLVARGLVLGEQGTGPAAGDRLVLGIAPQRCRQDARRGRPAGPDDRDREDTSREVGHRDDVPLQALGPVGGEQLHGVAPARRGGGVEPPVVLLRRPQEGEERRQRLLPVEVGEAGDDVEERSERRSPRQTRLLGPGGELDVKARQRDDPADQVEQRLVDVTAQRAQLARKGDHPPATLLPEPAAG